MALTRNHNPPRNFGPAGLLCFATCWLVIVGYGIHVISTVADTSHSPNEFLFRLVTLYVPWTFGAGVIGFVAINFLFRSSNERSDGTRTGG